MQAYATMQISGLHGTNGSYPGQGKINPIWALAEEVNLTTLSTDGGLKLYDRHGPHNWTGALQAYNAAATRAKKLRIGTGEDDISQKAALQLVGWKSTNDEYRQAAESVLGEFDAAVSADISSAHFSSFRPSSVEGSDLGSYSRLVVDQRGYDFVTRHLASKFLSTNDPRLVLNSRVREISYSDDGVLVRTDSTCYTARYAICTFSLSVLQQANERKAPIEFTPQLPSWKVDSISGNVMGIYTKVFYQFRPDEVFWPKEIQSFYYASPTQQGWWAIWQSLDFPGSPLEGSGIIFASIIWEQSKQIEQQSDDETMQQGLQVLQQMFPNETVPQPSAFLYPRWSTTPWTYGSYPGWATGYSAEAQTNLRANLGSLWFAGDATSSEYWGYLHGAYYEGQLVGEEIGACVIQGQCEDRERYQDFRKPPVRYCDYQDERQQPLVAPVG